MDQYGLRFPVVVDALTVRVEMIREGRIDLGPAEQATWTQVPVLSVTDAFAEKLLANSDRWADRDDLARDLLDLAAERLPDHDDCGARGMRIQTEQPLSPKAPAQQGSR